MSKKPLPLSVFVVTLNEEANLRRCLGSLEGMAAEIVVVDSGSTDGTKAVADEFGAQWFEREWGGFRDQKNYALAQCTQPWVLNLDADEELSPELREAVLTLLADEPDSDSDSDSGSASGCDGYEIARLSFFLGRWIRHGDWYPDWTLRLFRREQGQFAGYAGHDKVAVKGRTARLPGDLLHYSYPTTNDYLQRMPSFADAFLKKEIEEGKRWSLAGCLFRPWWRFFRGYVLKAGFLDGFPGLWIAAATAFAAFVRHSRLYEHGVEEKA